MQTCLADQLDVPVDDGSLATFLQWAVDQGLVPAREEPTAGPDRPRRFPPTLGCLGTVGVSISESEGP